VYGTLETVWAQGYVSVGVGSRISRLYIHENMRSCQNPCLFHAIGGVSGQPPTPTSLFSFSFSLVSITLPPCRFKLDAVWVEVVRFPILRLAIATCHCSSFYRTHQSPASHSFFFALPLRVFNENYRKNCNYANFVLIYVFLFNGADRRTTSTCEFLN